ncbi:hypothetical protein [Fodinicola acaciae]|uniref:hypothetical protein n=1 Tax=Fodinicola acaciae TaxID=2681555 RepID=UPI0013D8A671|nr:hypothetical protein [Fodinicola acaciae]
MPTLSQAVVVCVIVLGAVVAIGILARGRGYPAGGQVVVRCRDGHLFTTIWLPGVSVKAIRLGPVRLQFCPVAGHWTVVTPVPDDQLTDAERLMASRFRDSNLP